MPAAAAAARSVSGDALAALVQKQHDELVAAIVAVTGLGWHDAEDVLSIVTLRVLLNGVSVEPASWFGYMREAARNEAQNTRRSERRRRARQTAELLPLGSADPHVDAIAARDVWLDVLRAVAELPEGERQVVVGHYWQGLTYAELARDLGVSSAAVDKRLRSARARLRARLGREDGAYACFLALLAARLVPSSRTAPLSAPALTVAGVAVLSVLAVTVPAPRIGRADIPRRPLPAAAQPRGTGHFGPAKPPAAGSRRDTGRTRVTIPLGDPRPPARPRGALPLAPTPPASACAAGVCVGTDDGLDGDRFTVARLGQSFGQNVTPVCWAVPDNPEVGCRSDDPDAYVLPPPAPGEQEPPGSDGKSSPSAPGHREPTGGHPA